MHGPSTKAPRRSRRRFTPRRATIALVAIGLVAVYALPASAAPVANVGLFELDGNVADSPAGLPDDWSNVFAGTSHANATSFDIDAPDNSKDAANPGTIFTTGGSKDDLDVPSWRYTNGSVPDKDDIQNAMAARYDNQGSPAGTYLYFGADRSATNGDSQIGFWFFQNKVKLNADGTFDKRHVARDTANGIRGDILVLSDFTQGGGIPTVRVYEWVGAGNASAPCATQTCDLDLIGGGLAPAKCSLANADPFCAIVNDASVTGVPWNYQFKGTKVAAKVYPPGAFYEGGIDLSFLGLQNECFSSFLAETRSSQSADATLKDFVLGGFGSCGASLATTPSKTSFEIGGSLTDTAKISVTGPSSPPAPTGTVTFSVCGPTAGITSCAAADATSFDTKNLSGAVQSGNDYSVTSAAFTPTAAGKYCFRASWPGDTQYTGGPYADGSSTECFTVTPKTPTITTQVSNAGPVVPGTAVSDTATLGNTATPSNATQGTIRFRAYGPDDATCATSVYTSVAPVSGNGNYNSFTDGDGGAFAPTAPGTYRWRAFYTPATGDVNNIAVSTACGDANESFVVQQFQPTLSTAQTWTVKDSAKVEVSGGGDLDGAVTFELHKTSDCSDPAVVGSVETVDVNGASGTTVSSTPITFTTSQPTLYWKVSYHSDNGAQKDIAATCTENSSLTVTN
jgi:hypothetical protein